MNSTPFLLPAHDVLEHRSSLDRLPLSVIILCYNESRNIVDCLRSLEGFAGEIILVDSGSTDDTLALAAPFGVTVYQHPFENYSKQRNWALQHVDLQYDWVLNLDADHRLTAAFKEEVTALFAQGVPQNIQGFMASRRTMFMGRWIRYGGHYPVYHGVMFRKGRGYCEEKEYDQHFVIEGESQLLKGDVIDIITDSLTTFTQRHNRWASLEAQDALELAKLDRKIKPNKNGNAMERRRYQRMKYYSYPLFWRVFLYSFYRYVLKGGFRDGTEGAIFHFLQGFWFRFLVDAKIYEQRKTIGQ